MLGANHLYARNRIHLIIGVPNLMATSNFEFIPASFTPFTEEGAVDLPAIPRYVDHLAREKLRWVFINGTTGESLLNDGRTNSVGRSLVGA